jgi:16S rRNA (cytosine967-C5)-methyltransferase
MTAPGRAAALTVLRGLAGGRGDLGSLLARAKSGLPDPRDRALAGEIATGVLRHRAALDFQVGARLARSIDRLDPEVLDVLRVGAFQLLHLTRVPPAAVVNDAVAETRRLGKASAGGLVNAVLRRLAREREHLSWPPRPQQQQTAAERAALVRHLAIVYSHPDWLVERWLDRFGPAAAEAWLAFNLATPALTLAVNTARTTREGARAALTAEGVETTTTPHSPAGLTVLSGRALETEAFRAGYFVVQDEASQLMPLLLDARPGERIFDVCAAPGGKTLMLAAGTLPAGYVVASDVRPSRMRLLARTITRLVDRGVGLVQIPRQGALPFAPAIFDSVLVDAPCSGLGTVRRDPDIKWRRRASDLPVFAGQQVDLLARVAPTLRPGGRLVYSTCSSEPEENEGVIARFLGAHSQFRLRPIAGIDALPPSARAMSTPEGYLLTMPFRDGLEAFFGAVLVRGA